MVGGKQNLFVSCKLICMCGQFKQMKHSLDKLNVNQSFLVLENFLASVLGILW